MTNASSATGGKEPPSLDRHGVAARHRDQAPIKVPGSIDEKTPQPLNSEAVSDRPEESLGSEGAQAPKAEGAPDPGPFGLQDLLATFARPIGREALEIGQATRGRRRSILAVAGGGDLPAAIVRLLAQVGIPLVRDESAAAGTTLRLWDVGPFPASALLDAAGRPDASAVLARSAAGLEDVVYRRLAERAGVPFDALASGSRPRDPARIRAATVGRLRAVAISGPDGRERTVLAPRDGEIAAVLAWCAGRSDVAVTTPRRLEACLRRAVAARVARTTVAHLRIIEPTLSAARCPSARVRWAVALGVTLLPAALLGVGFGLTMATFALAALGFLSVTAVRLHAIGRAHYVPDTAIPDADLPRYTVLVPLRHEAAMLPGLMRRLEQLDYPEDRLEIRILVEADDRDTAVAAHRVCRMPHVRVITVPPGPIATKPRALVYGFALTTGDLVTVFDAEDRPDPDQLRKAAAALLTGPDDLACVQARLEIDGPRSLIARQFAIEYAALFGGILPWLASARLPLPLGGTSNHFKRAALETCGGWDPYNVTEDADLGTRLARFGFVTGVLDSATRESAPERWRIWHRQRVRWLKGWMMTWIVHSRRPRQAMREMGRRNWLFVQLYAAATILAPLVHPIGLALLAATAVGWIAAPGEGSFWADVLGAAALWSTLIGYLAAILAAARTLDARGRTDLIPETLLTPVYWLIVSWAAWCAVADLLVRPHHWAKTPHEPETEDGALPGLKPASRTVRAAGSGSPRPPRAWRPGRPGRA